MNLKPALCCVSTLAFIAGCASTAPESFEGLKPGEESVVFSENPSQKWAEYLRVMAAVSKAGAQYAKSLGHKLLYIDLFKPQLEEVERVFPDLVAAFKKEGTVKGVSLKGVPNKFTIDYFVEPGMVLETNVLLDDGQGGFVFKGRLSSTGQPAKGEFQERLLLQDGDLKSVPSGKTRERDVVYRVRREKGEWVAKGKVATTFNP